MTSDSPTISKRPTSSLRRKPLKKRKIVIRQKPSVRFNQEIEVHKPRAFKTPLLPSSTWLKEKDLSRIRDGIFSTLDAIKKKRDAGFKWNDSNKGKHCSRGLEDYSIDQTGSLKASTIHRRQNAIRAVLHEQETQMKRHRKLQSSISKQKFVPLHKPILDHAKLSRVYQDQTSLNIHEAIHRGRVDSEQALAVYSEPSLQLQPHRRSLLLPFTKTASAHKISKAKKLETTWGFATTTTTTTTTKAKTKTTIPKPTRTHHRIVSVS